jgi:hypothetical protein
MNDARPERRPASGRAFVVAAALLTAAAVALGVLAFRPADVADEVVLDVTSATAAAAPTTVPLLPATDLAADSDAPAAAPSETTEPEIELSPLAALLGVPGSAIPPAVEPRIRPRSITIDDTGLRGDVRAVGLEESGELEVPDETEIGWYRYGSSPGRAGATVLAAHVTWNGNVGPFFNLGDVEPGDRVEVGLEDGTLRTYEVVERTMYDKDSLPRERIWRTTGDESLVLITCGGSFNPDINRYRQNIVVYAVPVGASDVRDATAMS